MRKFTITLLAILLAVNLTYAGGLVTNTNQSAAWSRMLVRDASTSIDAVYFNPAGLAKLADGFYISLSNQSIFQKQTLTITQPSGFTLNQNQFTGDVSAPVFPDLYLAYKTGKWAFSFGFNVVGGGGGAEFKKGIPMDEIPIAGLVPQFAAIGVTGYSLDAYLKGTSMYFGFQAGATYEISPTVSVYIGGRYNLAMNSYTGHLKNIRFIVGGNPVVPGTYVNGVATQYGTQAAEYAAQATGLSNAATGLGDLVTNGAGGYTLDQLVQAQIITAAQAANLKTALGAVGATNFSVPVSDLNTNYSPILVGASQQLADGSAQLAAASAQLSGAATMLTSSLGDQNLDVKQKGAGFTPIIGANFSFLDNNLNIGIKYEFKTKMTLTNTTATDPNTGLQEGFLMGYNSSNQPVYMFPDGAKTNADIPSFLSVGVKYNVTDNFSLQAGYHSYGDKKTGWKNVSTNIGRNFQEFALGGEINVSPKVLLSAGYLLAVSGVNQGYQSDLSYSLTTNTFGFGGAYKISNKIKLNLGAYKVSYTPRYYRMSTSSGSTTVNYTEMFEKSTWAVAIGLDFSLTKNKKK